MPRVKFHSKLGRRSDQRRALLRSLVTTLLEHGGVQTTTARAKNAARMAEKMISLAKRGDLHARRQALAYLLDEDVVTKLFDVLGPRYADRNGGYTRVLKLGQRQGDGAPMARVELV